MSLVFLSTTSIGITDVLATGMWQSSWTPVVTVSQSTSIWIPPVSGLAAPALCVPSSPDTVTTTANTTPIARAPTKSRCGFSFILDLTILTSRIPGVRR